MSGRLRVGVVFGGRSGEHEVSLRSARFVLDNLDPAKYEVVPIGVTKSGEWLLDRDPMRLLSAETPDANGATTLPVTLPTGAIDRPSPAAKIGDLDVLFPVMHGTYGEDGTVQGLLELAGLPYVGAGVTGSAVGMDKAIMKSVFRDHGLPVAPWMTFVQLGRAASAESARAEIEAAFEYPVFVKPCNLGSSVGVAKVHDATELPVALEQAAEFDRRVIVERAVPNAREIEVSVLGNDVPAASVCGEIFPGREFYDYHAKYDDDASRAEIPADLPAEIAESIRELAVRAFAAIDAAGYARVDFLLDGATQEIFVSEINTIPGMTSISMFPKLWEADGLGSAALLDRMVELGLERHGERSRLRRSYT